MKNPPSSLRSDSGSGIGGNDAEMRGAAGVAVLLKRFDVDALSVDQLTRLQEMMPTEMEVRSVVAHAKALLAIAAATSCGVGSNASSNWSVKKFLPLGLTVPETFILGFKDLPRARAKLSVMQLMKTFDGVTSELENSFATVRRALGTSICCFIISCAEKVHPFLA